MGAAFIRREIDCPRCHQQCGWCSDYRWYHGTMKMAGASRRCTVQGLEPEGDDCPICKGARRVMSCTAYEPI